MPGLLAVFVIYLLPCLLSVTDPATHSTGERHNACVASAAHGEEIT